MQNSNIKRLIAVALTVVMMLTAIPFSSIAADEATPKAIAFGTYSDTTLVWDVLEKTEGGDYVLISKNVIAKEKFGGKDYAAAPIFAALNTTFFGSAFTAAEQAYLKDRTVNYTTNGAAATVTGKVTLPSVADQSAYSLGAAELLGTTTKTEYWLADQNAKTVNIRTVSTTGTLLAKGKDTSQGYRAMIVLDGTKLVNLTAADNVTYTTVSGAEIDAVAAGTPFKVVLAEAYSESAITVKANGAAIEAVDGVYTASASPITVEGITANPADYTAYDAAFAQAAELNAEDYSAETWAALEAALAVDVANLTVADQAKVDEATAAITAAITALVPAPADFTAYNEAVEYANYIIANPAIYNLDFSPEGTNYSIKKLIGDELKKSSTVLAYTKIDQELVDAAAKTLADLCAAVPVKLAAIDKWQAAVDTRDKIDKDYFEDDYVDAVWAIIDTVVAEQDFRIDRPDMLQQAYVDAQTKRMTDVIGNTSDHLKLADFTELNAALALAATYEEANYYKDDEVERDEEKGGSAAWDTFANAKKNAEFTAEQTHQTKKAYQSTVDEQTEQLVKAMADLDQYIRLNKWDRFVKDVKYFFSDIKDTFEFISDLLKTLSGLLKLLFAGEIDLYGLFEMLGVDQEVLDFLIKIGIEPTPEIEVPDEPTPAE